MKAALFPCAALLLAATVSAKGRPSAQPTPAAVPLPDPLHADRPSQPDQAKSLWTKHLDGYISDVNVAKNGSGILISMLPNYDRDGGSHKNQFAYFSRAGRMLWNHEMPTALKAQALADDGGMAVGVTHDNQIVAFDRKGKNLWTQEGNCAPMFLSDGRGVLCFHDDDAAPSLAYEVFDLKTGKKTASFPISHDVLALRLSGDEKNVVVGLTGGEVISIDPDSKARWHANVPGEIVDLDISSGNDGWVAVLYRKKKLAAAIFDPHGKKVSEISLAPGPDQIRFYLRTKSVALYGNSEKGQVYSWTSDGGKELWKKGSSFDAHYSPPQVFSYRTGDESRLLAPYEDVAKGKTYLLSFDRAGKLALELPIEVAEGAFLYVEDYSPDTGMLAAANDDGTLAVFHVSSP